MIPISTLLRNVSIEVERLAQVAEGLDEIVGHLAASDQRSKAPLSVHFQDVDVLRQALHAIARVTLSAARDIPNEADMRLLKDPLAEGVTLERVRDACLRTSPHSEERSGDGNPSKEAGGEPSFFEEF